MTRKSKEDWVLFGVCLLMLVLLLGAIVVLEPVR
jgi:hypothetical protein